ncbi:valine-tRNA ligase (VARS1) [Vairimorpha necatrix]|uniref:valine--tRNA ligase n=1 Tax=Vairimorpha necatrix TaxID=6039 RepID=A0AAX4JGN2_9MICR
MVTGEDRKKQKEEKKKQKMEKFLNKKISLISTKEHSKPIKLTKGYDPKKVEKKWSNLGDFSPVNKSKKFVMCMPPPNITGSLHIGHAMMVSIQDSIVRYKRLNDYSVLYLPGTDHAGIATQSVVMKQLTKSKQSENNIDRDQNKFDQVKLDNDKFDKSFNIDRDTFIKATWDWKEKYGNRIIEQFKRLGTSSDNTRMKFTMDEKMNKSVNEAFCRFYEKGLIYRENKIVNWCSKLNTTLSDIEIDHVSVKGNTIINVDGREYEFGVIYKIKYPVQYIKYNEQASQGIYQFNEDIHQFNEGFYKEDSLYSYGYVIVATTRPETILGDTALCAHPNDLRYNKYKEIIPINPITNKKMKFIFDEAVDKDFESGVLKITPAHDPVDFEIGKRHNLEQIKIFNSKNEIIINEQNKKSSLCGCKRLDARDKILEILKSRDLFIEKKPHEQTLPFCSRSNDLIEPIIKEQWWLKCEEMSKKAINVVKNEEIKIFPKESKEDWYRWFENPRDWCLSRQLWWGHRIPAYKFKESSYEELSSKDLNYTDSSYKDINYTDSSYKDINYKDSSYKSYIDKSCIDKSCIDKSYIWTIGRTKKEAVEKFNKKYNTNLDESKFEQDEDVLDTWFSSGLWPFATLGWPEETEDFSNFFPTNLLETGKDILFFWVGRMVMMSLELTNKIPFENILLHGIVRDANGRKMSKSLGNVIDPLHIIEGASLEDLLENMRSGNLSKENQKSAEEIIKKDYPNGIECCGADALRFTLLSYMNGINDIKLDIERVIGTRRFCNKIYNASIFLKKVLKENIFLNYSRDDDDDIKKDDVSNDVSINVLKDDASKDENKKYDVIHDNVIKDDVIHVIHYDKLLVWLIQKRNKVIEITHESFRDYKFMTAVQSIHKFFLYDFCDIYIEIVKKIKKEEYIKVLFIVFIDCIKIFSIYMPFITQEIYSQYFKESINETNFPEIIKINCEEIVKTNFEEILSKVKNIRNQEKEDIEVEGIEEEDIEYIKALVPHIKSINGI